MQSSSSSSDNNSFFSAIISIPWNKGIHIWSLKQLNGGSYLCGIGIISTEGLKYCNSDDQYILYIKDSKVTSYCMDSTRVDYIDHDTTNVQKVSTDGEKFQGGDIITLVVDCDKWILEYYKNDIKIHSEISMNNTKSYHAAFTV